ncbi:MAG: ATP-binding protein [Candidatus Omnitrophota bacterium]
MSIYSIPYIIAAFLGISSSIFVFIKDRASTINKLFALFGLCNFIWLFSYAISYNLKEIKAASVWLKIGYTGVIFLSITGLHFNAVFLGFANKQKKVILASYLSGCFFVLLLWNTNYFIKGYYKYYWGYYPKAAILHPIYLSFFACLVVWIFLTSYLFMQKERNNLSLDQYTKMKYIPLALFVYTFAAIDFIQNYGIEFYPLGFIFVILYIAIMSYAILRYRLMDIDIVIKKTSVYSILVTLTTIAYFALVYSMESIFRGFVGYKSIPWTLSVIAIFILIFQPLKNAVQSFIDKYFFKGSQVALAEELQKAQEELKRAERLKAVGTLAAGMAHEIKNPLTGIKTFTEYLPEKYNEPGFIDKFHKIVSTEVDKINAIVQQLLDFSKPKPLKLQKVNIHQIIDQTLSLLSNSFIKYKIALVRNYDNSLPLLSIDPNQIQQVFCNLFLNAIEAMKSGGELTVTTANKIPQPFGLGDEQLSSQEKFPTAQITISDTGKGISKKDLEHIFDPFYTTKETGTGLGMSIIYGIIKEHKGTVEVKSKEDKGTIFIIKLPLNI